MSIYEKVKKFKKQYPLTVAWRLKKNSSVIEEHICNDESVLYVFTGQKNEKFYDFFSTCVVVITTKRILIGRKRVFFGYFLDSVMPYMFNDINVKAGLIWSKITIDTAKELIVISNIDKSASSEIEKNVTNNMYKLKKEFKSEEKSE